MKRPRQTTSLQSLQAAAVPAKPTPKAKTVVVPVIQTFSAVVLTQSILYRSHGGKDKLIRPGYKQIPRGAVAVVKSVADDGKSFQIQLRQPVTGILSVDAQEIKILQ